MLRGSVLGGTGAPDPAARLRLGELCLRQEIDQARWDVADCGLHTRPEVHPVSRSAALCRSSIGALFFLCLDLQPPNTRTEVLSASSGDSVRLPQISTGFPPAGTFGLSASIRA